MRTIASYSNEEILPYIGLGFTNKKFVTSEGIFKVKMGGVRLECLKRNQVCVWCRRAGNIWKLERHQHGYSRLKIFCFLDDCPWCAMHPRLKNSEAPHLNLYHRNKIGGLIMMTRDHILPRSRGGEDVLENLQTLCRECNQHKGNSFAHEFDSRGHRYPISVDVGGHSSSRSTEVQTTAA